MSQSGRFSALFEFATEGILVIDESGQVIMSNPSSERLFGYEKDGLNGKKVELLIPERFAKPHVDHRTKYNKNPHARNMGMGMDLYARRQDGSEFPVEVSLSPFVTDEGRFVIAFIVDNTFRKKNEETLKQQKLELEQLAGELEKRVRDRTLILEEALHELERSREELSTSLEKEKELNELKTRFVSMASHEFRTPLATILSSLTLVSKYGELNDKDNQVRHINRIKTSVNHMTDILNDMLSISKLEEGRITAKKELFNIAEFAFRITQELQAVAKNGQMIEFLHSGQEMGYMDGNILRTILFNLISNAIKFSPEFKPVQVMLEIFDEIIKLKVKDNGIGIADEDQEHLFERFFRGHNVTNIQGTGLGLNIIGRYIELLKGSITFESQLNKGTIFIIELPNTNENE